MYLYVVNERFSFALLIQIGTLAVFRIFLHAMLIKFPDLSSYK